MHWGRVSRAFCLDTTLLGTRGVVVCNVELQLSLYAVSFSADDTRVPVIVVNVNVALQLRL